MIFDFLKKIEARNKIQRLCFWLHNFHPPFYACRITQKFPKKEKRSWVRNSGPFRYRRYRFTEIATKKWTRSMGRDTQRINCGLCIQPAKYSEMGWPLARREQTSCTDLEWVQSVNGSLRFEIRLRSRYSRQKLTAPCG